MAPGNDSGKKRGRKPAEKLVLPNNDDAGDDAEYQLKMELIELVQGYPEIYDIGNPLHKKTAPRARAWDAISQALFIPGTYISS